MKHHIVSKHIMLRLGLLLLLAAQGASAAMSGREVMELANHRAYYSGGDRSSTGQVVVKERGGTMRTRSTHMVRLDDTPGGEQSYLVYFSGPTDMEGTTFLVHKHPGKTDERWLYLPELDIVRRIEAGDKRTHFVGTDLFYEDVSGRHLDADRHSLTSETDKYWIVRSEPKDPNEVEFAWYESWVHKDTHLAVKIEYHDRNDRLYRRFSVKKVRNIGGIPTPMQTLLEDLNTGSQSTMSCLEVEYGRGLSPDLFSERSLRHPPLKQIKLSAAP
ncbi:outer membrane lipoprotein-sorting protein [Thiorhodococcus mannitoliphagus]|uniref:Outer membrane lipoprotein-sorting protein n=1 Tax=Thiorhodococcus mannitoliphagus TaxID=329406 RepID=A0A6P1DZQ2_9GAMM|nr:outer membrane lipoprotein-sorting protein [Thiorhodococcus mannitoliphagus]NEX23169.1 outer membrane lipoprotein-sorting protein [Thiorhodococcus mannitoliphagus]